MNWYLEALKKYTVFSGRACRSEYWYFLLFNFLISIGLVIIDFVSGTFNAETGVGLLSTIYSVVVLIPGISVTVRRLHDTDRSGWWFFIALIPIVGAIVLFIFMVLDSSSGDNEYGPNPK
ncbi:MAG TPA: DUF805 domain-containing protein [Methylobacter sp.]|jgi:uncharacterized membrane protein YhaH (DUF805 family)